VTCVIKSGEVERDLGFGSSRVLDFGLGLVIMKECGKAQQKAGVGELAFYDVQE
jgi:hypothetical protein